MVKVTFIALDGTRTTIESVAFEVTDFSRLSCQLKRNEAIDGLVVRLPEEHL